MTSCLVITIQLPMCNFRPWFQDPTVLDSYHQKVFSSHLIHSDICILMDMSMRLLYITVT